MDHADAQRALGAADSPGTMPVAIFIPDSDRYGDSIDQEYWVKESLRVLGRLFRGATALPPGRGVWRDDATGTLLLEGSVLVFSLAEPHDVNEKTLSALGAFARKFGRDANQGEVGVYVTNAYHPIFNFVEPTPTQERDTE